MRQGTKRNVTKRIPVMEEKYTPFMWLADLTVNKKPWLDHTEDQIKTWSTVLMNKIIGTNPLYVEAVNYIQKYISILPPKEVYLYYQNILPKSNIYFPFKKAKKSNNKLIELYSKYSNISIEEVSELYQILGKKEVILDLQKYGLTEKEIQKLI
jgi:hypothetical protein